MSILTDRVIFSGSPATNDLIHIVDVSDPTDNPAGTSFAIEVGDLVPSSPFTSLTTIGTTGPSTLVSGTLNVPDYTGVTFTGNTSGDCITDLYITNLYGCSPLHIEPSGLNDVYMVENGGNVGIGHDTPTEKLHVKNGDILVEGSNGKVYTHLANTTFRLSGGTADLSTIGVKSPSSGGINVGVRGSTAAFPGYGEQGDGFVYSSANQNGLNIISQDGTGTDYIRFYAGKDCTDVADMFIVGAIVNSGYIGMGTETPTEKLHVVGNTIITGTLNIETLGNGTSVNNLGIDSSGNVVTGTTGGGTPYLEYKALLTQTGTTAPSASVLNDTLAVAGVWTYSTQGVYYFTSTGGTFTDVGKVEVYIPGVQNLWLTMSNLAFNLLSATRISNDVIEVKTAEVPHFGTELGPVDSSIVLNLKDNKLSNTPITIRVWS
jgi:hypothetical protein